jgi:hypothetical protein
LPDAVGLAITPLAGALLGIIMRKTLSTLGVAAVLVLLGSQALAHHSFAMFDQTKEMDLTGVVKEFQWTNPHSWIQLEAPKDGKNIVWSIEGSSPNGLRRQGWSPNTFKPGDKVTVTINPLKDGGAGGSFVRATLANGQPIGRPPESVSGSR